MSEFIEKYSHFIFHYGNWVYLALILVLGLSILYIYKHRHKFRTWLISFCAVVVLLLTIITVLINFPLRPIIESASRVADVLHQPMPDFEYDNLRNGKREKISDLKGRVLIINFWATYCGPCVKELPMFAKLENDYGEKIYILAISDETAVRILRFMEKHAMPLRVGRYSNKPWINLEDFRPLTIVIDKAGNVNSFAIGEKDYAHFENEIKSLLIN